MNPKTFLVGGAVRDTLMGKLAHDKDYVVVGATPEWMLSNGYKQVGADFPVFLDAKGEEYALARTERKVGAGYHGFDTRFDPSITIEDDLYRRDLTVNAIAQDSDGNIIDPYNGREDIKAKRLRHVSEAFREDPVRVLRLARFRAKFAGEWTVDDSTVALCHQMVESGELNSLTKERVWKEFEKALHAFAPEKFFLTIHQIGASKTLFPEFHTRIKLIAQNLKDASYLPSPYGHRHIWHFAIIMQIFEVSAINEFCRKYGVPNEYRDYATDYKQVNQLNQREVGNLLVVHWLKSLGFYQPMNSTLAGKFGRNHNTRYLDYVLELTRGIGFNDIPEHIRATLKGKDISHYIDYLRTQAVLEHFNEK